MTPTETDGQAAAIAAQLQESDAQALQQIQRAIEHCGLDFVQAVLVKTLDIEAEGGHLLSDGSRRRTPGGVFFRLLREQSSPDDWRHIRGVTAPPAFLRSRPLEWAERVDSAQAALTEPGIATSARITVAGRPREVKARDGFEIATIDGGDTLPALPRGLPGVEHVATLYKVCIGEQAWRRVERALDNPDGLLIADGYAVPNRKAASVTVLARFATAKEGQPGPREGAMKIQLIGRPGKVIRHGSTVVLALISRQAPRLPEELPEPPPVTYLVYSVEKQWNRVEATWQQTAGAALMIDGYCFYDVELKGLAVLAQRVTVKAEQKTWR